MSDDGPVTLVTTLHIEPDNAEEVLSRLKKIRDEVMVNIPGHRGVTIHVSLDRSRVLLLGEWASRADLDAVLFLEEFGAQLDHVTEVAKSHESVLYKRIDS